MRELALIFLRSTAAQWFAAPGDPGTHGIYEPSLRKAAKRQGLDWTELEPAIHDAVEHYHGRHYEVKEISFVGGLLGKAPRTVRYYELPPDGAATVLGEAR